MDHYKYIEIIYEIMFFFHVKNSCLDDDRLAIIFENLNCLKGNSKNYSDYNYFKRNL